jgi:transcriptional regulator with XRE-family HTH domain
MRIIDGASPITVWREKRAMMLEELASAVGLAGGELAAIESGGTVDAAVLNRMAGALDVRPGMLAAKS